MKQKLLTIATLPFAKAQILKTLLGKEAIEAVLDDLRVYLAVTRHAEDGSEPPAGSPPPASA